MRNYPPGSHERQSGRIPKIGMVIAMESLDLTDKKARRYYLHAASFCSYYLRSAGAAFKLGKGPSHVGCALPSQKLSTGFTSSRILADITSFSRQTRRIFPPTSLCTCSSVAPRRITASINLGYPETSSMPLATSGVPSKSLPSRNQ